MNGVQNAPFRGGYADGLETAVVVGYLGADRALHTEGRVRGRVVEHDVDAPLALGRRALVVNDHLVALYPDRDAEPDRLVEPVRVRLVLVDPIRQRLYRLAHGAFGAVADLVGELFYVAEVELIDHVQQPRPAEVVAPCLGV